MSGSVHIGLIGGTFDPVHYGHLRAAEEVQAALGLTRVMFIPAAAPPHKLSDPLSSPAHRLEMVRKAIAGNPRFEVSNVEISELEKPSYTVQTVTHLRSRLEGNLTVIIGMDSFVEIPTWKDFARLFELCHLAVVTRPGFPAGDELTLPSELAAVLTFSGKHRFVHNSGNEVRFIPITGFDISSTRVRELVRTGQSIRYLVPPEVEAYIYEKKLYQKKNG